MTIALTAHDAKKELMVQFCIAYCGILLRNLNHQFFVRHRYDL